MSVNAGRESAEPKILQAPEGSHNKANEAKDAVTFDLHIKCPRKFEAALFETLLQTAGNQWGVENHAHDKSVSEHKKWKIKIKLVNSHELFSAHMIQFVTG